MKTEHIVINSPSERAEIERVGEILRLGGTVAIPTETVYGLAADATNEAAVAKIFEAKGRPQDNPLIVHISDISQLESVATSIPESAFRLFEKFSPGPLTVILPRGEGIPAAVSAGLSTVAVRIPQDEIARAIISASGRPLAAPSANLSGSPSPTTAEHCIADLEGKVWGIVISHDSEVGVESTVVSLCHQPPRLLRPGAITHEMLQSVLGEVAIDPAVLSQPEKGKPVASPGMKYKHYSPKTRIILVSGSQKAFAEYANSANAEGTFALCFEEDGEMLKLPFVTYGKADNSFSQAAGLFAALRELDERGAKTAFAHAPQKSGMGLAVYNRLIRAAGFEEIILD